MSGLVLQVPAIGYVNCHRLVPEQQPGRDAHHNWLFWLHEGERRNCSSYLSEIGYGSRRESSSWALLFGGIWCLYIAGAVLGSYTDGLWRLWPLACPLAVLAVAIAVDLWRPFHP